MFGSRIFIPVRDAFAVGREGRLELELRRLDERSGDASFARDDKKIALPVAVRVEHDFLSIRGIARRPITARVRRQRALLAAVERHDPQVQIPGAIGIQYELGAIW